MTWELTSARLFEPPHNRYPPWFGQSWSVLLLWFLPGAVLWFRMFRSIRRRLVAQGRVLNPDDASLKDQAVVTVAQAGLLLGMGALWPLVLVKRSAIEERLMSWPQIWFFDTLL